MRDSLPDMPTEHVYSFYPGIGYRPYSDIIDNISVQARHMFTLMREHIDEEPFTEQQIDEIVRAAGHEWSALEFEGNLQELVLTNCLVIEDGKQV